MTNLRVQECVGLHSFTNLIIISLLFFSDQYVKFVFHVRLPFKIRLLMSIFRKLIFCHTYKKLFFCLQLIFLFEFIYGSLSLLGICFVFNLVRLINFILMTSEFFFFYRLVKSSPLRLQKYTPIYSSSFSTLSEFLINLEFIFE